MGTVLTFACERCGQRYDPSSQAWFNNNFGDQCHLCDDGIVGARVECELDKVGIDTRGSIKNLCPCCGGNMHALSGGCLHLAIPAEWAKMNGPLCPPLNGCWLKCSACLICHPAGDRTKLYLDEINSNITDPGSDASIQRHIAWVAGLSGYDPKLLKPRALGISMDTANKLLGRGTRRRLLLTCGNCELIMDAFDFAFAPFLLTIHARGLDIIGLEASMALRCPRCSRVDYYLKNERLAKYTWCLSDLVVPARLPAGAQLPSTPQKIDELRKQRPAMSQAQLRKANHDRRQQKLENPEMSQAELTRKLGALLAGKS